MKATEILVHGADADEARLAESFARLCELAGKYGLRANIEPMPWVDVSTVAQAKRILKGNATAPCWSTRSISTAPTIASTT